MSSALDMSLDDIIKSNKTSSTSRGKAGAATGGGGRGRPRGGGGGGSGPGPSRRFNNRASNRTAPYSKPAQAPDASWKHDMFSDTYSKAAAGAGAGGSGGGGRGRGAGIETGTKVLISNLDYGVSNDDIKELYAEVGDIKRCGVHYDRSGRSEGTADVVFARRGDAVAAVKRYNGVQLDGKPMKVEIVGTNIASGGPARSSASNGVFGREIGALRSGQGGGFAGRPRGGSGGGNGGRGRGGNRRGGGRGGGRGGEKEKVSAEDLDADLEKYHAGSMETD
ncbi:hypothetical protein ACFE04_003698 [Oxalis oulophora]